MRSRIKSINSSTILLTLSALISLIFMFILNSHASQDNHLSDKPVFLILGDSLSAGYGVAREKNWVSLLQQRFNSKNINLRIINASISGDTSGNGLARLPKALQTHQPKYLLIELGANDGLRGLPLNLIRTNLKKMITLGQAHQSQVLLMAIRIPPNYGKKYTQRFNHLYTELTEKTGVQLLPFMLNKIAVQSELMQSDRLHPNEKAQALIMENVWAELKGLFSRTGS